MSVVKFELLDGQRLFIDFTLYLEYLELPTRKCDCNFLTIGTIGDPHNLTKFLMCQRFKFDPLDLLVLIQGMDQYT